MSGARPSGHKVARPAARYRPGKAPVFPAQGSSSSARASVPLLQAKQDSYDDESDYGEEQEATQNVPITDVVAGTHALRSRSSRDTAGIVITQGPRMDIKLKQPSAKGEEIESSEYETDTDEDPSKPGPIKPVCLRPGASSVLPEKDSSSELETDTEEEDSSEDAKPPPLVKPTFVPKRLRATLNDADGTSPADDEAVEAKAKAQQVERRKWAHELAAERIKADLASKEFQDAQPDLSDTDGKDPEAEFLAWRVRELQRIARAKEAERAREQEQEEIEKRREMPEEQRLKEDIERAKKSREEKQKGDMGFMQKYYHKGAFFQDMDILKRNYSGKTESAVDKSSLPALMQVRDYGKASRSKWTHLAAEDTTKRQEDSRYRPPGFGDRTLAEKYGNGASSASGCFLCGGGHLKRDCPQNASGGDVRSSTGTNNIEARGERSWGASGPSDQVPGRHRRRDDERGHHGERSNHSDRGPPGSRRDRHEHRPHTDVADKKLIGDRATAAAEIDRKGDRDRERREYRC
ncbi:hypothetical protein K437DRAFT_255133 [Tilletiaria anomala UBC 951]|uniref:Micro-fibrillar-associated protein 1 C-terminal domain-containing protein n=1 Tax=Tilletiaria anomala (strain ATCC 24038 / CBS 436.72 / UBC 951) TaxID=1037660 RepID=A0A066WIB3_TILAU|nr:uncharacterized protein K437DRAFT_255133 [Tilletiaria anomala UBC 951]KDN50415.1 hypothetical protein K437DRAFT_255133 [Tilletiaria anomala UBC 951]